MLQVSKPKTKQKEEKFLNCTFYTECYVCFHSQPREIIVFVFHSCSPRPYSCVVCCLSPSERIDVINADRFVKTSGGKKRGSVTSKNTPLLFIYIPLGDTEALSWSPDGVCVIQQHFTSPVDP